MRLFAFFACAALAVSPALAVGFQVPSDDGLAAESGTILAPPPDQPAGDIDIGAGVDAAFAAADTFPAERYELDALAKTFGSNPKAAFDWVRDHIRIDPYAGLLREPEAVLAASGANAADRARLLKALLEKMGIKTRYATASLDEATAHGLRAALFAPRAGGPAPAADAAFNGGLLDRIRARAGRDAGILSKALGPIGEPVAPALPGGAYVWVQAEIDGAWVDLDTTLPDAVFGAPVLPAQDTPDMLDESWNQTVTFLVVATTSAGEQTLLTTKLNAGNAAASQILLYFEPKQGGLGGAIAGGGGYLPVLLVDGKETKGEPIAGGDGGAVGGAIDALGGGGDEEPALQALTLKIVTEAPGADPITATRVLAAAGPDGTMAADDVGLLATRWLHNIIVSNGGRSPREFAILKGAAMEYAASAIAKEDQLGDAVLPSIAWPTTSANLVLPTASERLFVEALNSPGTRAFVARPRVFIASSGPLPGGEGGSHQGFTLDLALDDVAVIADGGAGTARARLWYGVLEAALETEYGLLRLAAMTPDGRTVEGASLSLGGAAPTVIGPNTEIADAPAAMKADLSAGARVVVGGDPAAAHVWWTVRPDGLARAVLDPSLGGLTGGGGYLPPGNYVNGGAGGPRYIIDPNTGNTIGEVRNGRDMMYRGAGRAGGGCRGANEYSTILGCVSIPGGLAVGVLGAVIVVTYGYVAVTLIRGI